MSVNRNPNLIFPPLLSVVQAGISKAQAAGISVRIFEGFRSVARQNQLYAQGRSLPGKVVTQAQGGMSWHQWGLAIDLAGWSKEGWHWDFDPKATSVFFPTLKWGGDFGDPPHYEWKNLPPIKDIQKLSVLEVWDLIKI